MDPQVRNFREFLVLYNRLTEMCFSHCTDTLFSRKLSTEEANCIDKCVIKFSNVNQKMMSIYVEAQTEITQKRQADFEEQMRNAQAAESQANLVKLTTEAGVSPDDANQTISSPA